MKRKYRFNELSRAEKEYLEMVLLEEMDVQSWYAVTYSEILGGEFLVVKQ